MVKQETLKKTFITAICIMATLLIFFCAGGKASAAAKINKKKAAVTAGKSIKLKVTGTKNKAEWSSSNEEVATVSSTGKVTGKQSGTAVITASVGSKNLKCKVTVKANSNIDATGKPYANYKYTGKKTGKVYIKGSSRADWIVLNKGESTTFILNGITFGNGKANVRRGKTGIKWSLSENSSMSIVDEYVSSEGIAFVKVKAYADTGTPIYHVNSNDARGIREGTEEEYAKYGVYISYIKGEKVTLTAEYKGKKYTYTIYNDEIE